MLRVSSQVEGDKVNLRGIVDGAGTDTGIPFDTELLEFTETALGDDEEATRQARETVKEKMGNDAMVDAAGVIANFQRMVRIADATGIPLDTPVSVFTDDIRDDLGINEYGSASNTPALNVFQRVISRVMQPLLPFVVRQATKGIKAQDQH